MIRSFCSADQLRRRSTVEIISDDMCLTVLKHVNKDSMIHLIPPRSARRQCHSPERTLTKQRHVTLMILWEEYRAEVPNGHGYSRYCQLYSEWKRCLSATMRQTHLAGDKLFVDWAGDRVSIIDQVTGEVHEASIFVAVLGASSYTYSEARWTETLPDWIGAHVNTLHFLGGVMKAVGCRQ